MSHFELTKQTEKDIRILVNVIKQANAEYTAIGNSLERLKELEAKVSDAINVFNFTQKYDAIHSEPQNKIEDIIDYYSKHCFVLKAVIYRRPTEKNYYGITFEESVVDFSDFCSAGIIDGMQFNEFEMLIDSVCFYMKDIIPLGYDSFKKQKNPYKLHNIYMPSFIGKAVTVDECKSSNKLKNLLNLGIQKAFNYRRFPIKGRHIKQLEIQIFRNAKPKTIANMMMLWTARPDVFNNVTLADHKVTRHIAWCKHEHKRRCLLLDMECATSVGCVFYRESSLKKKD